MAEFPNREERKPHDLKGLLHFCTDLTAVEDAPHSSEHVELDLERREMLSNILDGLTTDVPKMLLKLISILLNDGSDASDKEAALEELSDHLDDLNNAIDFYKLGGCPALIKHLDSIHSPLRHLSAQLIGDVCQNNELLQNEIVSLDAIPRLLKMVISDDEKLCRIRAMYALSCLLRESEKAQNVFIEKDGFLTLQAIIEERREELLTKVIFLLNSIYTEKKCKDVITSLRFEKHLISLLLSTTEIDETAKEYSTKLILSLLSDDPDYKEFNCNTNKEFAKYLKSRLLQVENKSEFQEEESYIRNLMKIVSPS